MEGAWLWTQCLYKLYCSTDRLRSQPKSCQDVENYKNDDFKGKARNYLLLTAFYSETIVQYITFPEFSFLSKKAKAPLLSPPFCNDHVLMMTNTRVWDMFNCFLPLVRGYTPPSSTALFILYCMYSTCRSVCRNTGKLI